MLKIGDFSKMSLLTIKALRFYEKEGLLEPTEVDAETGYRLYSTQQLETASTIKFLRQLDFSIKEIKEFLSGENLTKMLAYKKNKLTQNQQENNRKLSIINHMLEDKNMNYKAVIKEIPECVVYSKTGVLKNYAEVTGLVLSSAEECLQLNPKIECVTPDYCFCEYLDGEFKTTNITARYSQAVKSKGVESENIKFRELPKTKVVSVYHKGSYSKFGDAYGYLVNFCENNGYKICAPIRECYIDGVWNKEDEADYLTELQAPVELM